LLLNACILGLLVAVVALHLTFHLLELARQRFPHIVSLCVEHSLKGVFLSAEHLHLSLVVKELVSEAGDQLLQIIHENKDLRREQSTCL